jgi:hypothetical protein
VVIVLGARHVGKSTLLEQVAAGEGGHRQLVTLDDPAVRSAAALDPTGFVATLETPVAIDEIHRVPELMTEIKLRADRDQTPGQFALTGSANLLEMKQVKDSGAPCRTPLSPTVQALCSCSTPPPCGSSSLRAPNAMRRLG